MNKLERVRTFAHIWVSGFSVAMGGTQLVVHHTQGAVISFATGFVTFTLGWLYLKKT